MTDDIVNGREVLDRCRALANRTDAGLTADLLAGMPVHRSADRERLEHWAGVAAAFGAELAAAAPPPSVAPAIRHGATGIGRGRVTLADFSHRDGVRVFPDAVDLAERLIGRLGWHDWYPTGSVLPSVLAHEHAHGLLDRPRLRELRRRAGHRVLSCGPWTVHGHVVGLDDHVAHAFAEHTVGLGRSPALLTAALAVVADVSRQRSGAAA